MRSIVLMVSLVGVFLGACRGNSDEEANGASTPTTTLGRRARTSPTERSTPGPDGKIAFVSERDGNFQIYVVNPDGSGLLRLTHDPGGGTQPAWSPDGSRIAFVSSRNGNDDILVMNADGSGVAQLTESPGSDISPSWAPDGSRIAFLSDRGRTVNNGFPEAPAHDVYIMDADGSRQTRLSNITDPLGRPSAVTSAPEWSPDGGRIAFIAGPGAGEMYVMNADGSGLVKHTDEAELRPSSISWWPDGDRIVFADGDVYVLDINDSVLTNLTNNPDDNEHSPVWSSDGTRIAFVSTFDMYVMKADGSGLTELTEYGNPDANAPLAPYSLDWSPDSKRIAFYSISQAGRAHDIYVVNADGSGYFNVSNNPAQDWNPVWSPVR